MSIDTANTSRRPVTIRRTSFSTPIAYGGFQPWKNRAGRFRSLGDGQVDFGAIFSKLATYDFDGWAVLEWECFLKHPEDGAAEGAKFIREHIIRVADRAFDDFVKSGADKAANRQMLGLG